MTLQPKPLAPLAPLKNSPQNPDRYDFDGLKAERQLMYAARAANATPTPRVTTASSKTGYCGTELRPYAGRPDAMNAHALPSRTGKRLRYPDGRVTDLAGRALPEGQAA